MFWKCTFYFMLWLLKCMRDCTTFVHQSPDEPTSKPYDVLVSMLKVYYEPKPSIWAIPNRFENRTQEPNESIMEFSTELKKLSQRCEFKCEHCSHCRPTSNSFLAWQFLRGLQDPDIRIKLLQEKSTSNFQDFIDKAMTIEYSKSDNKNMCINSDQTTNVYQVKLNKPDSFPNLEQKMDNKDQIYLLS